MHLICPTRPAECFSRDIWTTRIALIWQANFLSPRAGEGSAEAANGVSMLAGGKLGEIVDADSLLQGRYPVRHLLETMLAKELMLLFSKSSDIASYSCAETRLRSIGNRSVSTRAACGRYMVMNDCMDETSR